MKSKIGGLTFILLLLWETVRFLNDGGFLFDAYKYFFPSKDNAAWESVDLDLQKIIDVVIARDGKPVELIPTYKSGLLEKAKFLRDSQASKHPENWAKLKDQIPVLDQRSSLQDWKLAVEGHRTVEKQMHPDYVALELSAQARELARSDLSETFKTVRIPTGLLKFAKSKDQDFSYMEAAGDADGKIEAYAVPRSKITDPRIEKYPKIDPSDLNTKEYLREAHELGAVIGQDLLLPAFDRIPKLSIPGGEESSSDHDSGIFSGDSLKENLIETKKHHPRNHPQLNER